MKAAAQEVAVGFGNSLDEGRAMDPQKQAQRGEGQDICKREKREEEEVEIKGFCGPQTGAVDQRRLNFWGV